MIGKVKKIFFTGMFGVLYISFVAQLVYIIGWSYDFGQAAMGLGLLSIEWLALIAARYLSKKSASGGHREGGYNNHYRR